MMNALPIALIIQFMFGIATAQQTRHYWASGASDDWYNANQYCVDVAFESLASINTDDDYKALRDAKDNAVPKRSRIADDEPFWVGLSQQTSEAFAWIDGTQCETNDGLCVNGWLQIPDINNNTEYCVTLTVSNTTKASGYRAVSCAADYRYICSYKNETNSSLLTPDFTIAPIIADSVPPTTNPTTEPTIERTIEPTIDPTADPTIKESTSASPTTKLTIAAEESAETDPTNSPSITPMFVKNVTIEVMLITEENITGVSNITKEISEVIQITLKATYEYYLVSEPIIKIEKNDEGYTLIATVEISGNEEISDNDINEVELEGEVEKLCGCDAIIARIGFADEQKVGSKSFNVVFIIILGIGILFCLICGAMIVIVMVYRMQQKPSMTSKMQNTHTTDASIEMALKSDDEVELMDSNVELDSMYDANNVVMENVMIETKGGTIGEIIDDNITDPGPGVWRTVNNGEKAVHDEHKDLIENNAYVADGGHDNSDLLDAINKNQLPDSPKAMIPDQEAPYL